MIIVDSRENGNFDGYEKQMLDLGDYQIYNQDKQLVLILEKKTLQDYIASIKDGRLHEQVFRLKECGIQTMILVEGIISDLQEDDMNMVMNSIVNKMVHDKLQVIITKDFNESLDMLQRLDQSCQKINEEKTYLGCSKSKKSTEENSFERILMTIPGVSANMAEAIKLKHKTLPLLLKSISESGESALIGIQVKSRKIGKVTASKIISFLLGKE